MGGALALALAAANFAAVEVSEPPASVAAGQTLTIRDTVRNTGAVAAKPRIRFLLSNDRRRSRSDRRLIGVRRPGRLRPGRLSSGKTAVKVPLTAPLGAFHVLACVRRDCVASRRTIEVTLPAACTGQLQRLGVEFRTGPATLGVADPVTVRTPINGIAYARVDQAPDTELFMDCELALSLHAMADTLTRRGVNAVEHFGIYEYRCIADTDPCVLSEHAKARAIDLHAFHAPTGATYDVETDWVIDPEGEPTCAAATENERDAWLHALVCEWDAINIFHVLLTPNYNADHRNHFHLDLAENDFIG